MKKLIAILALALLFASCKKEEKTQESSIIPNSFMGRSVQVQGTVEVGNKKVDILIWDSGQIDGDIVSLYVNGKEIIANYTLTASKKRLPVTLDNKGYNYILLYAHNEGTLPPNTCAVSLDDGAGEKNLVLSADLKTNGAYNIVVK
ncbi:hypothetical protein [Nubsella zeaxanthinifaciens]|uniref:hypothetical protein n=1 Tax=Nubsella zeaxanthinifaciens TaxID=392412 RepID=UPI000DE3C1FE|nr:hypothetical protein [Nubsella zeaxanthinifaciens]